jgi:putative MFS transporter
LTALGGRSLQHVGVFTGLIILLLISSGGVIAMLLPYSAELYPSHVRATASGLVAGTSKLGGLAAQCLGLAIMWPGLKAMSLVAALPITLSALVLLRYGVETRRRSLEDIDIDPGGIRWERPLNQVKAGILPAK